MKNITVKIIKWVVGGLVSIFGIYVVVIAILLGMIISVASSNKDEATTILYDFSEAVRDYQNVLKEQMEIYNVPTEHTIILLAIMQESSAGIGQDVMASKNFESNTEKKTEITPEESIKFGVIEYSKLIKLYSATDITSNDTQNIKKVLYTYHLGRDFDPFCNGDWSSEKAQEYITTLTDDIYIANFPEYVLIWQYKLTYTDWDKITNNGGLVISDKSYSTFAFPFQKEYYISCEYGQQSTRFHTGIDITCSGAQGKPIYAAEEGVISITQSNTSYGNCILITHNLSLKTRYAHLSKFAVSNGEFVKKGQLIGYCGSTGNSTGPHLHFEVIISDNCVDPTPYLFSHKNNTLGKE